MRWNCADVKRRENTSLSCGAAVGRGASQIAKEVYQLEEGREVESLIENDCHGCPLTWLFSMMYVLLMKRLELD